MITTLDGHEVRIATGGVDHDPTLPSLLLIHGAGMDRTTWQMQTRWFAHHGYRVAAVDLPGHGLSAGEPLDSIEAMADWTATLIDELELGPTHLVGFSLGTFVALEVCRRHPSKTASLVLIGTASAMPVHPELLTASTDDLPRASRLMTSWALGSQAHKGGHVSPGTWLVGASTALIDSSPEGALAADMAACNVYEGALGAGASVSCPVTLVLGTEDKMTPIKAAKGLIESIPHAEVVTLGGSGHMLPIERPVEVRRAIASALDAARSTS